MSDPIISANIPDPLPIDRVSDCFITGTGESPTETFHINGSDQLGNATVVDVIRLLNNPVTITVACDLGMIVQDPTNRALWRYTPPA